jgi:hypothetical protein
LRCTEVALNTLERSEDAGCDGLDERTCCVAWCEFIKTLSKRLLENERAGPGRCASDARLVLARGLAEGIGVIGFGLDFAISEVVRGVGVETKSSAGTGPALTCFIIGREFTVMIDKGICKSKHLGAKLHCIRFG